MRECGYCGKSIVRKNAQARYCSDKCRNYDRRRKQRTPIPHELANRDRWIRYSAKKVPLHVDGKAASSTDPNTWASYSEAVKSTAGVGLGFVLGDGLACIDLDHCITGNQLTAPAAKFIANYPQHYIEISPSGEGLHIWGKRQPGSGSRKTIDGLSIEQYSTGRYITITGNVYQHGNLLPL